MNRPYRITDLQLSHLRTQRGYTEDESELAARAADEIEYLRGALVDASQELDRAGCQLAASQAHQAATGRP